MTLPRYICTGVINYDGFFLDEKGKLCYDNETMPAWWNR